MSECPDCGKLYYGISKDGKIVTVVMNQSDKKLVYNLCIGTQFSEITIAAHAIQTLVY